MRKSDIEISYHQGTSGLPMVNVKMYRFEPTETEWQNLEIEFPGFRVWLDAIEESDRDYLERLLEGALEFAQEGAWETAQNDAEEVFGRGVKVYSAGRSGGWCVVDGLPDVEEWDAIAVGRWSRFAKYMRALADDMVYQAHWGVAANVYETESLAPVAVSDSPSFT